MRSFLFALGLSAFSLMALGQDKAVHRLLIHPSSKVTINGKTNVNKYQCVIPKYNGADTLVLTAERGKGAFFQKGKAKLNASEFDCGMQVITKDFSKTLETDKYPYIEIDFRSFERVPTYESSLEKFKGKLVITLVDKSVPAEVRCSIIKDEKGFIHLRGKHHFKFSDFGLKPPSKMGGMIKVDEKIAVEFHLVLLKQ